MNLQEARICNQKKYGVTVNGEIDTFGYWTPKAETVFIISAIREYYNSELKHFSASLEIAIPNTGSVYTVAADKVLIAPAFEKLLKADIDIINTKRLERIISQMITDGETKSGINDIVRGIWDKVSKAAKKDTPSFTDNEKAELKEIVEYLNEKAGTDFRASSRATQRLIKARMNEGYDISCFKKVIDNKVADWKSDSKMVKYLRPETLFGTKFEGFLNEQKVQPKGKLKRRPGFDIDEIARKAKYNDNYEL